MTDKIDRPEAMAQRIRHLELELKRAKNPANKYERTVAPTVRGKVYPNFIPLTTPLTSTAWDGDAYSNTTKTKIDLSSVFSVPAGVKAVLVKVSLRDSGSAATSCLFQLSGVSSGTNYSLTAQASPINDRYAYFNGIVPCDDNGDIYYNIVASGTDTMDVFLEIWGYWL